MTSEQIMSLVTWIGVAVVAAIAIPTYFVCCHTTIPPYEVVVEPNTDNIIAVAVMPFADVENSPFSGQGFGNAVRDLVDGELPNYPGIASYTRSSLDQVLREQNLYFEGFIDPALAIEIGKFVPVRAIITGKVLGVFADDTKGVRRICISGQGGGEETCTTFDGTTRSLRIHLTLQVIDTLTGQILVGENYELEASEAAEGDNPLPEHLELSLRALGGVAEDIASKISNRFTKAFKYGLYRNIKSKWVGGVEGIELREFFNTTDRVFLMVYVNRISEGDILEVDWINPDGEIVDEYNLAYVGGSRWIYHQIPLTLYPHVGQWVVEVTIGGFKVLADTFMVE